MGCRSGEGGGRAVVEGSRLFQLDGICPRGSAAVFSICDPGRLSFLQFGPPVPSEGRGRLPPTELPAKAQEGSGEAPSARLLLEAMLLFLTSPTSLRIPGTLARCSGSQAPSSLCWPGAERRPSTMEA